MYLFLTNHRQDVLTSSRKITARKRSPGLHRLPWSRPSARARRPIALAGGGCRVRTDSDPGPWASRPCVGA